MVTKATPPLTAKGKRLHALLNSLPAKIGKSDAEFLMWYVEILEGYAEHYYSGCFKELLGLHRFPDEKETDND